MGITEAFALFSSIKGAQRMNQSLICLSMMSSSLFILIGLTSLTGFSSELMFSHKLSTTTESIVYRNNDGN